MSTDAVRERLRVRPRRSARALAVSALGPLTALAGAVWGVLQPYRLTVLDPLSHGFWDLLVQPPLLVVLVGVFFHLVVANGVLDDAERQGEA